MATTEITICSGTLCYIMGGADFFEIESKVSELYGNKVKVKASPCMGFCEGDDKQNPPCVTINNHLIPDATIEKIIYQLKQIIG
jgi:NADH:ubiquinone oxidoreductase subunit E